MSQYDIPDIDMDFLLDWLRDWAWLSAQDPGDQLQMSVGKVLRLNGVIVRVIDRTRAADESRAVMSNVVQRSQQTVAAVEEFSRQVTGEVESLRNRIAELETELEKRQVALHDDVALDM